MSEQAMSDERLEDLRSYIRASAHGAERELLAEVDRLRAENAELEAADDASYLMRRLVRELSELDRASQIGRRMRFNLTDLIRQAQQAMEPWEAMQR